MPPKPAGLSGYSQNVVVINDHGLQERTRTSPTGKTSVRYTVSIQAGPLVHDLNPKELAEKPAQAMAEWLRARVKTIQASASPSTKKKREQAAKALAHGEDWALARYAGGKMGSMAPGQSKSLFNDSGRFAASIIARPVGDTGRAGNPNEWVINVAANRLDPETLSGPEGRRGLAALQMVYARLIELVPEFGDSRKLMAVPAVKRAIADSVNGIIKRNADLRARLGAARLDAAAAAWDLLASTL
jgi:hypothetical protein